MHFKRRKPNPKHDDYRLKDSCYKAGRAAVMQKKKEPTPRELREEIMASKSEEIRAYFFAHKGEG